jgi:purine-binding chemotaxis protein CheW
MADARKRARERGRIARTPPPPAEGPPPDTPGARATVGGTLTLPPSGLAEDILPGLEAAASPPEAPAAEPAPPPEGRIELPSSGLAQDVLGRVEAASVPLGRPEAAAPAPAETSAGAAGGHSLSFFSAPAQEQRVAAEATEHLATFLLEHEEYGIDVRQVQEIRRVTEITGVPRAPEFVRGVINLRGRILPVLDLKRKLGLGSVAIERATRIVVVRVKERLIGLLVDGASQVLKVKVSRIEAAPEEVVDRGGDYIRGVAKLDDRLVILIDLERTLAHELRREEAPEASGREAEPV